MIAETRNMVCVEGHTEPGADGTKSNTKHKKKRYYKKDIGSGCVALAVICAGRDTTEYLSLVNVTNHAIRIICPSTE